MSVIGTIFEIGTIALPTLGAWLYLVDDLPGAEKRRIKRRAKILEASKIDGRTEQEWYELIKDMGKDVYEELSLAPLDGLERSKEMGWDIKRLMGPTYYKRLMDQWYPERVFPRTEIHAATNTRWYYGEADFAGVMTVKVSRGDLSASTQILASSFEDLIEMTKDSLYKALVEREQYQAKAKEKAAKAKQKALEQKQIDFDWLKKAIDKQKESEFAARKQAAKAAERARQRGNLYSRRDSSYYNKEYGNYDLEW